MRIGYSAEATPAACWWLEEIDGLMKSTEKGPIGIRICALFTPSWLLVTARNRQQDQVKSPTSPEPTSGPE